MAFRDVKRKKEDFILSLEIAEEQMRIFLDFYEMYPDEMSNPDMVTATELSYDKLISAIRKGRLEITLDNGLKIKQTLQNKTEIQYSEITGIAKIQDQKFSKQETSQTAAGSERTYSVMASLTNLEVKDILQFKAVDLSILESLGFMLLNV